MALLEQRRQPPGDPAVTEAIGEAEDGNEPVGATIGARAADPCRASGGSLDRHGMQASRLANLSVRFSGKALPRTGIRHDGIVIATASDDRFLPGLLALIHSAHTHNPGARFLIIDMGLSPDSHRQLDRLLEQFDVAATVARPDRRTFALLPDGGRFTRAAYARFLVPELLPDEARALYIDADAVVVGCLRELWELELGDLLVAAAGDEFVLPEEAARAGLEPGDYFNSGVLLMNLARWRSDHVAARAMQLIAADHNLTLPDQTALNAVCRGRIAFVGREWNLLAGRPGRIAARQTRIIHFTGEDKPWRRGDAPLSGFFRVHAARAGVDLDLPARRRTFRQRLRLALGLACLRPKHWRPLLVQWRDQLHLAKYRFRLDSSPRGAQHSP